MPEQTNNQQVFDPSKANRTYTTPQWKMKEDWYVNQVNSIYIPPSPTPADLSTIACKIEAVLTVARLDMAFIEQNYNRYNIQCKLQESILFTTLKSIQNAGKLTIDEKKSMIAEHINKAPYNGGQLSLYELREKSDMRYVYMKNIIQALMDKKDLLITHSAAIKADTTLASFTPNVPNDAQAQFS